MTKPKAVTEPGPSPAEIAADEAYRSGETGRRVAKEQARADAWLALRGGRDEAARRLILERVQDMEAFRVLTGCRGNAEAAVKLLASLAPAVSAEDEENAA
jgi:hypothetical protein